jgi:hypothetical protein
MSPLSTQFCSWVSSSGGVIGYPLEQLHEEVACIAYHFHWSLETIINLEHIDRRRWILEIGKLKSNLKSD